VRGCHRVGRRRRQAQPDRSSVVALLRPGRARRRRGPRPAVRRGARAGRGPVAGVTCAVPPRARDHLPRAPARRRAALHRPRPAGGGPGRPRRSGPPELSTAGDSPVRGPAAGGRSCAAEHLAVQPAAHGSPHGLRGGGGDLPRPQLRAGGGRPPRSADRPARGRRHPADRLPAGPGPHRADRADTLGPPRSGPGERSRAGRRRGADVERGTPARPRGAGPSARPGAVLPEHRPGGADLPPGPGRPRADRGDASAGDRPHQSQPVGSRGAGRGLADARPSGSASR
jgi:hypothetical protein